MTKLEQAARQALVALEDVMTDFDGSWVLADTAITALREALDQDIDCPCGSECIKCSPRVLLAEPHKENCACEVCRGCDNADIKAEQAEQEPVGEVKILRMNTDDSKFHYLECQHLPEGTKLYTRPVRTKDLTDDEIEKAVENIIFDENFDINIARAVIAADREKNK